MQKRRRFLCEMMMGTPIVVEFVGSRQKPLQSKKS
jgi:hypothetical protein